MLGGNGGRKRGYGDTVGKSGVTWGGGAAPLFVKAGELFKDGEVDIIKVDPGESSWSRALHLLSGDVSPIPSGPPGHPLTILETILEKLHHDKVRC